MPAGNYSGKQYSYYSLAKDIVEKQGQIYHKESKQYYGYLEGFLVGIESADHTFKDGQTANKIKFKLAGRNFEQIDVLECGRYTFFSKDILNRLMSLDQIGWVKLTPYISTDDKGKNYVRGSARHNLTFVSNMKDEKYKVKFHYNKEDIPPIEYVKVANKLVKDDLKQNEFYDSLIIVLNTKLAHNLDALSRTAEEEPDFEDEIAF